ncbi:MAG: VWA domain-containing protein [Deltaproteobacteria bacterium]|nr:VWA domain-containing protein [Deltaproteobacteria bacterium]MBW1944578.1 VWA domain-containing protein [Deltaproteobacteria bacterium]
MRKQRRDNQVFSLSFLDCICCCFGAIILLFVLSKFAEPVIIEEVRDDLQSVIARLQEERHEIRGQTHVLNRKLTHLKEQVSKERERLARLQGDLSEIEGEFAASKKNATVQNTIEGKLARALQDLTKEMQRLLKNRPRRVDNSIGGIPVDSEYIIFIIDTSGSMQRYAWRLARKKLEETLKVYPKVKGIQIMNDMGDYMFHQYQGKWIPDTPARRKAIVRRMITWRPFSNSSPVEGIRTAIRTFYDPKKKISLFVFGDEYSGNRIQPVIDEVGRINRAGPGGEPRVRIHAVGFPVLVADRRGIGATGQRFATLMRTLCQKNGGTFVGLNSINP